jgi:hypothetical protein
MKITLREWKEIEAALDAMRKAIEHADCLTTDVMFKHYDAGNKDSYNLLGELNKQVHDLRGQASLGMLMSVHPQSEWMGGDSDNPKNHKLREPNCCPAPRRYFTAEEMEEVGAENQGPCQWTFKG